MQVASKSISRVSLDFHVVDQRLSPPELKGRYIYLSPSPPSVPATFGLGSGLRFVRVRPGAFRA